MQAISITSERLLTLGPYPKGSPTTKKAMSAVSAPSKIWSASCNAMNIEVPLYGVAASWCQQEVHRLDHLSVCHYDFPAVEIFLHASDPCQQLM